MNYEHLSSAGLVLFKPKRFEDDRGYFSETFRAAKFKEVIGQDIDFVQDNRSYSKSIGTVRGLHYQSPPFGQGKLVSCCQGAITDVAVDVRKGSPSFGQYICAELNEENGHQLWIPEGFLHGFVTREPHTIVQYKCTNYYAPECDGAVLWSDEDLAIDWKISGDHIVSDKDANAQSFKEFGTPFTYE